MKILYKLVSWVYIKIQSAKITNKKVLKLTNYIKILFMTRFNIKILRTIRVYTYITNYYFLNI